MKRMRLGVDVGGTFTDFVLLDDSKHSKLHKRLSTPDNPSVGIIAGLSEMMEKFRFALSDVKDIVHGTTVVANALIERKGQPTGLITTDGFRDVLEIGREVRYDIYDLDIELPQPLVPRYLRFGVRERTLADGKIRSRPTAENVLEVATYLSKAGIKSLAICLLHSHRNPENENKVAELIGNAYPDLHLSLSSQVAPEIREYERISTTVANAYVHPLLDSYLEDLVSGLAKLNFAGNLYIMMSQGGITTANFARRFPIQVVESGPAAGVQAASFLARHIGARRLLSFDMGGTTAKACVVDEYEPSYTVDLEVARIHRFKAGSGLPLKVASTELIEIGAGGGSIAWLNNMKLLKIGPESAGASPGPACYGLGGIRPTVTDADLVLGYLNPENFLGGAMKLDVERAKSTIREHVAEPLKIDIFTAAAGIVNLANENMATAARLHVAERGRNSQNYALMAFGGAGPVHSYGVARALRISQLVFPAGAGALSALGFLVAPVAISSVRSYVEMLDRLDWSHLDSLYNEMMREADEIITAVGADPKTIDRRLIAEMRFFGQGYEIPVSISLDTFRNRDGHAIRASFEKAYHQLFETKPTTVDVEVMNWRLSTRGPVHEVPLAFASGNGSEGRSPTPAARRSIYLPEAKSFMTVPVFDRYKLTAGDTFEGPAIVEEREATVVINGPGLARMDEFGNLLVDIAGKAPNVAAKRKSLRTFVDR